MECLFLTGMYLLVVLDGALVHSEDCGFMTVSSPVLKNRPVTISLTPTPPVSQDNTYTAEWLVFYIVFDWRQPKNFTDEFDVNLTDGKYILTIKNTTREGSVDINFRLYNNAGGGMCSQNKRIVVKVLKDCGLLHAPVSHVKEGQSAYLSYYPAMSRENHPDSNHTRTLYFTPTSKKENVTVQYSQTWDGDTLSYTIELPMFQSNMSGKYRIKCTSREQDWKSSSVNLQLASSRPLKPSLPTTTLQPKTSNRSRSINPSLPTTTLQPETSNRSRPTNPSLSTTTLQPETSNRSRPTNPSLSTTTLQPETSNRTSGDITTQIWFWPAVGGGAVFIIICFVIVLVYRKNNRKAENAVNAQDEGQPRDGGPAAQGEENDVTYAVPQKTNKGPPKKEVASSSGVNKADANGPVGAAVDGPVEAGDTAAGGDVYAVVIPRSERTIPTDKVQNPNQLVYAELELHTDPQPKNNPKEGVEITDYVTIDFNETKT